MPPARSTHFAANASAAGNRFAIVCASFGASGEKWIVSWKLERGGRGRRPRLQNATDAVGEGERPPRGQASILRTTRKRALPLIMRS